MNPTSQDQPWDGCFISKAMQVLTLIGIPPAAPAATGRRAAFGVAGVYCTDLSQQNHTAPPVEGGVSPPLLMDLRNLASGGRGLGGRCADTSSKVHYFLCDGARQMGKD